MASEQQEIEKESKIRCAVMMIQEEQNANI